MPEDFDIIALLSNFALPFLWLVFLKRILHPKFKAWVTMLILISCVWVSFIFSYLIPIEYAIVRSFIGIVTSTIVIMLIYKDKWAKKLFASGVIHLCVIITEAITMLIFSSSGNSRDVLTEATVL